MAFVFTDPVGQISLVSFAVAVFTGVIYGLNRAGTIELAYGTPPTRPEIDRRAPTRAAPPPAAPQARLSPGNRYVLIFAAVFCPCWPPPSTR